MKINISIIKDIPEKEIANFTDLVIHDIARTTLDLTEGHFPRLTGELEQASMAMGVVGSNGKYGIGTTVDYAKYVWPMPQETNWTNANTYAQWYLTTFKNKQEGIINQAITGAIKKI